MSIDKKLQVFNAKSLYDLEVAYKNFKELKVILTTELSKEGVSIDIPRSKTDHTLNVISNALASLNDSSRN
jgi:hypothetical protein